jgi:NADP-reducing hydrogenase subunit HndC
LIVVDDGTCIVELTRYFLDFLVDESCGKCPPCRVGIGVMLRILERITRGEAIASDLESLESVAKHVQRTSLCGLGRTAPNAVLSTLRHFREEYEAHVYEGRCPAAQCRDLPLHVTAASHSCGGRIGFGAARPVGGIPRVARPAGPGDPHSGEDAT